RLGGSFRVLAHVAQQGKEDFLWIFDWHRIGSFGRRSVRWIVWLVLECRTKGWSCDHKDTMRCARPVSPGKGAGIKKFCQSRWIQRSPVCCFPQVHDKMEVSSQCGRWFCCRSLLRPVAQLVRALP